MPRATVKHEGVPLERVNTVIGSFRQTSSRGYIHSFFILTVQVRHLLAQSCVLPALENNSTSGAVSPFERRNLVADEIMDRNKYRHRTESVSSVGQDLPTVVPIPRHTKCTQK